MTWSGYASVAGNEVANNARVVSYARAMRVPWFKGELNEDISLMLGDGEKYRTPLLDEAPWTDPDVPESYDFLGFYCQEITGVEDSSRGAEVVEYLSDGGSAGRIRHSTKSVVVNGMLVSLSEAGADYGMRWLRQATLGGPCDSNPFGGDFCYLSSEPFLDRPDFPSVLVNVDGGQPSTVGEFLFDGGDPESDGEPYDGGTPYDSPYAIEVSEGIFEVSPYESWDPTVCLEPFKRVLRKFKVLGGPQVTQKYSVSSGALWGVQFTGVAGVPWEFGAEVDVVSGLFTPEVSGVATDIDVNGFVVQGDDCAVETWLPLNDPLCPTLIAPPGPVDVQLGCVEVPSTWTRRQFTIPSSITRIWTDMVPIVEVHAPETVDLRNLRLRFYADPFDENNPNLDPCGFCGDILFSYVPQGSTLTFDAASETVYVTTPGGRQRRADSLVFGADGKPFDWPSLSCGFAYVATLDLPQTQELPVVDLQMVPRSK